ncbi:MAG: universal stress protein [Maribacter sp.]|nr:universal stress protein [Maribacter sp.]
MEKISTILVPFDFSDTAKAALEYAVTFVGDNKNMDIHLAYVTRKPDLSELKKAFAVEQEKYKKRLKRPLKWITSWGSLQESLIKIEENRNIDLVIMGTSGAFAHKDPSFSNTSKFVLESQVPVLVIPKNRKEFQIKNIALVLGKEEIDDKKVLENLLKIANKFNAKVHVLTIENTSDMYGYSQADQKNENLLEYYLESFYSDHTFLENPDVVKGILAHAIEKEMDMIAILPRNHAKRGNPSEGRLTELLTLQSPIPILALV